MSRSHLTVSVHFFCGDEHDDDETYEEVSDVVVEAMTKAYGKEWENHDGFSWSVV